MVVNPFWFGFGIGMFTGVVIVIITTIIYSKRSTK